MELFCITHIAKQTINKTLQHLQEVLSPLGKIMGRNYRIMNSQDKEKKLISNFLLFCTHYSNCMSIPTLKVLKKR